VPRGLIGAGGVRGVVGTEKEGSGVVRGRSTVDLSKPLVLTSLLSPYVGCSASALVGRVQGCNVQGCNLQVGCVDRYSW
jgi:hypothetical protein